MATSVIEKSLASDLIELKNSYIIANSTTKMRFAANPDSQNAYASITFYESSTAWTELIFNSNGIMLRRTNNGGTSYTSIFSGH